MRSRALLAILGVTLLAALLTRLPLARLPSYEAGVVVGIASALACCWLAATAARRRPAPSLRWGLLAESPGEQVLREARLAFGAGLVMIGVPVLLLTSEAARTGCRVLPGLPTYLFVAVPAAFAGAALGCFAASLTRMRLAIAGIAALAIALDVAWGLVHVLVGPRHVIHDLFVGPLSSAAYTGYDSALHFPDSVALHRVFAIVFWTLVLAAAAWIRTHRDAPDIGTSPLSRAPEESSPDVRARDDDGTDTVLEDGWRSATADDDERIAFLMGWHRRTARRATGLAAAALVPFLLAPGPSGVTPGRARLERVLSGVHETDHFRLRYEPGSRTEPELERLAVEHEAAWRQVTRWLDIEPDWKVTTWLHPDAATLFELTGARGYVFAAPWNREFHVHSAHHPIRNLRHELVHVLAAEFGVFPFGASLAPGLIEGLATALDEGYSRAPEAHEELAAAARAGHVPDPAALMTLRGFASGNMDRAYRSSASFVGWLLWRHGPEPMRRVYSDGDFEAAYGVELDELARRWRAFLDEIEPAPSLAARAERRFDPALRPAFHELPCPRVGRDAAPRPSVAARVFGRTGHHEIAADLHCEAWRRSGDPRELTAAADSLLAAEGRLPREGTPPPGRRVEALLLLEQAIASARLPADALDRAMSVRTAILGSLGRTDAARRANAERRRAALADWPEELELTERALDAPADLSRAHFSARLERGAAARTAHAETLGRSPAFAPALHRLLESSAFAGDPSPRLVESALTFADVAPEAPALAARHLLNVARRAAEASDWATARALNERALALAGARPLQLLAAREGAELAAVGLAAQGSRAETAQPLPPACRNLP